MKIQYLFFICLFVLGCSREISIQTQFNSLKIPYIYIKESKLLSVLDRRIAVEKACTYYSDTNYFTISITKFSFNNFSIRIESGNNLSLILYMEPKGFFVYKKHLFYLRNMDTDLFSFSNKKCLFLYNEPEDINIDDSRTVVYYSFKNGEFETEQIYSSCDN